MTIKFWNGYNERTNTHYSATAEIVTEAPQVGDSFDGGTVTFVQTAWLDAEQPSGEVYNFTIYELTVRYDQEGDPEETKYAAVEISEPEEDGSVENSEGTTFTASQWDAITAMMDDDIREDLADELAPCSNQEFFTAYAAAHLEKFGEVWELDKANPTW